MTIETIVLLLMAGAGLIHGLSSALFIRFTAKNTMHNRLLIGLLLFFSYRIGKSIAMYFLDELELLFIFTGLGAMLAIGPLLLLYFKALMQPSFSWKKKYWLHLLPALITIITAFYIRKTWFLPDAKYLIIVILAVFYTQFLGYILVAYRRYTLFKKEGNTAAHEKLSLWLRAVLLGISLIWVAYVLNIFEESIPYISGPILYSVVVYTLTLYAIKLDMINFNIQGLKTAEAVEATSAQFTRLKQLMEEEEPYLNPNLSLDLLARELRISAHQLSRLINEHAEENFNGFVNGYRVKKAQEVLVDENKAHLTISSLAMACGFNSLSSFNAAFKKVSGTTPSRYRKAHLTAIC